MCRAEEDHIVFQHISLFEGEWAVAFTRSATRWAAPLEPGTAIQYRDPQNRDAPETSRGTGPPFEGATPAVSAHASAATFFGEAGDDGTRIGETALETGFPYAALQFGKITTWYGPGRRGALLFTDNAPSHPGARCPNPLPIPAP